MLSADGGGIRGLSPLLILETIMHRIQAEENLKEPPLPCDYFHLIGGTSTGGIIAIMLGRLRMSVAQAIECYDDLADKVFRESKIGGDGMYKATNLEQVIKAIVEERTGDCDAPLLDDGATCKIFVCAMNALNMDTKKPVLFRSYVSRKEVPIHCTVWEAARATSAAPTFFKRIDIGPEKRPEPFIDGGVGQNNPTERVLAEARVVFPRRKIACVISVGTGQPDVIDVPKPSFFEQNVIPLGSIKAMVAMVTDCEETAQRMESLFERCPNTYFRFNVDRGLQAVKLGDWDRLNEVSAHTRQYMCRNDVSRRLDEAVRAIREQKGVIETSAFSTE
ncbi:FabD/lysophospholipase-like protein [Mycena olivaceomarginata]|nr:FabD/lysophospholipase-like protein [Mycena olivaceomarginata]